MPEVVKPVLPTPSRRVVVQFRPDLGLPYDKTASQKLRALAGHDWDEIAGPFPGVRLGPLYTAIPVERLRSYARLKPVAGGEPFALTSDFVIDCPPNVDPGAVALKIGTWQSVRSAFVQAGATPPPSVVNYSDDGESVRQGYLDGAPAGIGARWVWDNAAAKGDGVGFADLEYGWELNHEDLKAAAIANLWGLHYRDPNHGTNVLGIVAAVDNDRGIVGIAPGTVGHVVSIRKCLSDPNPCPDDNNPDIHALAVAEAILIAQGSMVSGDVILLESQYGEPNSVGVPQPPWLPAEVDATVYNAIRAAIALGITVVEVAGNNAVNLDNYTKSGLRIFDMATDGKRRDSGAIIVGSAKMTGLPHEIRSRLPDSNYGSRVNCFAWGEGICTTGIGTGSTALSHYPGNFGQTSGAAAIVAGAAVLLQSWRKLTGTSYTPARLRELLSGAWNTASATSADKIGVMPNLRAIIERESAPSPAILSLPAGRRAELLRILAGVANDGGGTVWKPGVGPVPIDPWGPHLARLNPAERDLLIGFAISELAGHASRSSTAARLAKAAYRLSRNAGRRAKRTD